MDFWDWVTQTSPKDLFTALGLGAIVVLFVTDRLLTKGQHLRRVSDITEHHNRELLEKDARMAEYKESLNYYRTAYDTERHRADTLAIKFSEVSGELVKLGDHLAYTFKEVAEEPI